MPLCGGFGFNCSPYAKQAREVQEVHVISFYKTLSFGKIFWIFFIGCILGVVLETVWCILKNKRYESRTGLIYGPFNLVYGIGAVVMTFGLSWLAEQRVSYIFILGAVIGGVYEYLCSIVQEKLFGTVSWDYKKYPLNLHGRINLLYCLFWGFLALLWVEDIYPGMLFLIGLIPKNVEAVLLPCCVAFMAVNTVMSACVVYRMRQRTDGRGGDNPFWKYIDSHYPDERVKKIYPNMIFDIH